MRFRPENALRDDTDRESLEPRLRAFLAASLPHARGLRIDGLTRTSSGKSRENWTFDAGWSEPGGERRLALILRRDPVGSLLRTRRRPEFDVLAALHGSGVPVPRAHFLDADGAALGRPSLVMERVDGDCEWEVLNGTAPLARRLELARGFVALLAAVQAADWRALGLAATLGEPSPDAGLAELAKWSALLREVQLEPLPELEIVAAWLRERARPADALVLVHGDFKPGNALLRDGRVAALLDWETAHLGDPLEDLGWVLNPTRAREHQIAGHWERAQIVAEFERVTGRRVDPAALDWWIAFSNFKAAVILLTGVREFVEGRLDQAYLAPTWVFKTLLETVRRS